jgi:hypothetical protein
MRNKSISAMALVLAMLAGAVFAPYASARTSSYSEAFWRCSTGYAFEVSGAAVHCKKPQWTETKAYLGCPIGTALDIDGLGDHDVCAGTNPVTGIVSIEPACNPADVVNGFSKRTLSGKDYCGKNHPAEVVAPSNMITL